MKRILPSLLLLATPLAAQETNPTSPSGDTITVSAAPFEISLELDASVESEQIAPISVAPEEWSDLTIVEAVSHGQRVKEGDRLVVFDTTALKKQISDLEASQKTAEITLSISKKNLEIAQITSPLDLEAAKLADEVATEALTYFEEIGKAQSEKSTANSLRNSAFRVDSAREELGQLTKMYEADDLTEETEEIILRRAKNDVESAEFLHEGAKLRASRTLEIELPRQHISLKDAAERARLAFDAAKANIPLGAQKQKLDYEKASGDYLDSIEKLKNLRADLQALDIRAPFSGLAYFGQSDNGKWTTAAAITKKLRPGGKILPHEIFLTVVSPERTKLSTSVAEDKLSSLLAPGITGSAHLAAEPGSSYPVRLASVGFVPLPAGGVAASIEFEKRPEPSWAPGRSAKVTLSLYKNANAITLPKSAIKAEGDKHFVTVIDADKRSPQEITTGRTHADKTEILSGLEPGTTVAAKP
ncbi:MAG: hypothetical protein P8J87_13390 [Verrucomicrobiales bacterium]|nr:hypothetical protein [Verrucomicrobiales bacterium]